jgi:hypothetical protein
VLSDLRMYFEDGEPIEVWFVDDTVQECCDGFIVTIGTDFVLIARLFQCSTLNGLRAIRLTAIEEILPTDDTSFIQRAMKAQNHSIPPSVPFHAKTLAQLLESVCAHYPIVIIDDDPANQNSFGVAGTIADIKDGVIHIRQISKDGYWVEGIHEVSVRHVNNVFFGSQYEETLRLIGELPDE